MDKNIFFSRLYEIPHYDNVIDKGSSLYLTLTDNSNQAAIEELQMICNMWGATFKVVEE